jgi:tRNA A37 threonylcarbamoyladenosine modification protein TsaB
LAAIAYATGSSEGGIVALLPAGRGEVFAQMFSFGNGTVEALDTAAHVTPQKLLDRYGGQSYLTWAGEGAHLHSEKLSAWAAASAITEWIIAPLTENLAVALSALALHEYRAGRLLNPDELRATYVRASDAEINERWQTDTSPPPVPI